MTTIALEDLTAEASKLLDSLGEGSMSPCAYDTAWVARLRQPHNPDEPLFPASFDWLLRNQHADGSWGAEIPFAHDRVICTMSALVALASAGPYRHDEAQLALRRGVLYLNRERPNLRDDPAETVGFELILPELVRQAKALDLRLPYKDWEFVEAIKADKLRRIPPIAIYGGPTTLTHSLEYLGDRLAPTLVQRCQSPNGSYGASPSATAYVEMREPDSAALRYLERVARASSDGGVPFLYPFETFETGWVLYYLQPLLDRLPKTSVQAHVKTLIDSWDPTGTGWTREYPITDSDDTAVVLQVLSASGIDYGFEVFELFESSEHFYCFAFERNDSVGANAHIVRSLRRYPATPAQRRMTVKVLSYLEKTRISGQYWVDKWHSSPYYATAEVIRSLSGLANEFLRPSVMWLLDTQRDDGSWGTTGGTVEETALAVHALIDTGDADQALQRLVLPAAACGVEYVSAHRDDESLPLWLGKGAYTPHCISRAMVLAALHSWTSYPKSQRS